MLDTLHAIFAAAMVPVRGFGGFLADEHVVHAAVVVVVVTCVTILAALHDTSNDTVGIVFGSAIGYAAGRSGITRSQRGRELD